MNAVHDPGFSRRIERIEALIRALEESADPATLANTQELLQAVLDLHGAGLSRVLDRLAEAGAPGRTVVDALTRDDLVGSLFLLHGLHPLDLETRVQQALDTVRPQLRAHGGEVALLAVADGVVRLRLQGSCHGCPSSSLTMRNSIEEAIMSAAPDVTAIEVEGVVEMPSVPGPPPSAVITVDQLLGGRTLVGPPR